ncbi:MAG: GIY-YIG nuclease family protein [Inquilinaceae bacterium]
MPHHVYILTNRVRGTLYVGISAHLARRVWQHRQHQVDGFTKRHRLDRLVHCEPYDDLAAAQARERQLKRWRRAWKIALIEDGNPNWVDLYDRLND